MGTTLSEQANEQSLPPAYKGPRGLILVALKRVGSLTARELGNQLRLSSNAIRHHLKELETEGVIGYRREQRGVGAPTFAWYLSAAGEALFPQRYKEFLTEVLDRVAEQAGRQAVVSALETRFADLARKLRVELADAPPEKRMEGVMRALVEGGYLISFALPVTFPKNVGPQAAAAAIPAANLLVETDSPYLGLASDQRNEPTTVLRTAAVLARLRDEPVEAVAAAAGAALAGLGGDAVVLSRP